MTNIIKFQAPFERLKDNNNNSELLNNPYCNYIKCVLDLE